MVWCPLGNREVMVDGGHVVDGREEREFSIDGLCDGCEADFGLTKHDAEVGEFVMALLVDVSQNEVMRCEIDEVL